MLGSNDGFGLRQGIGSSTEEDEGFGCGGCEGGGCCSTYAPGSACDQNDLAGCGEAGLGWVDAGVGRCVYGLSVREAWDCHGLGLNDFVVGDVARVFDRDEGMCVLRKML